MSADARRQMVVDAGFTTNGETATIGGDEYTVVMGYDKEYETSNGEYFLVEYTATFKVSDLPDYDIGTTQITVPADGGETFVMQKPIDRNHYIVEIQLQPT